MNPRHQRFIEEYLVDLNATRAYRAVYPKANDATARVEACKLLTKPNISEAIGKAQAERAKRINIAVDDVLRILIREANREGDGSSHSARVQAAGLLGRHLGMFKDKVEVTGNGSGFFPHCDMTDEQLDAEIARLESIARNEIPEGKP